MSDLQILTGISILISGYVQLKCRISCYHWQIIVYLAWFASLTHFACLTILRSYLYNHPGERAWRLVAMGCIVIMLTVALVPTGNYAWLDDPDTFNRPTNGYREPNGPELFSYAICHFAYDKTIDANSTRLNVGFSIALIIIAYLIRVILLHEYLSRTLLLKWRRQASVYTRSKLTALWTKWEIQTKPNTARRRLLYHPLLACFLTVQILLDLVASMFLEVSLLIMICIPH
jgi:ABC-type uncharacterized transport system fused permease/ATPase subunit